EQLPAIVDAAEAAATRVTSHPQTRIILPGDKSRAWFTEEFMSRAGGLANAWVRAEGRTLFREGDIILVAADHWGTLGEAFVTELAGYKEGGAIVIVFGSKVGMPDGL